MEEELLLFSYHSTKRYRAAKSGERARPQTKMQTANSTAATATRTVSFASSVMSQSTATSLSLNRLNEVFVKDAGVVEAPSFVAVCAPEYDYIYA